MKKSIIEQLLRLSPFKNLKNNSLTQRFIMSSIEFTRSPGDKKGCKITVYALSTCGFCKRALAFLRENSVDFEFVYVDKLDKETRDDVVEKLKEKFNRRVAFPFLIVDGEECMVGFNTEKYEDLLSTMETHQHNI